MDLYDNDTSIETNSFLTFIMNGEHFAVNVSKVTQLLEMQPITHVPKSPDYMRGVINLRGAVVPVIDTRLKFSLPFQENTIDTCIVVMSVEVDGEATKVGAIVDSVSEVIEISKDNIQDLPSVGQKQRAKYIEGVIKFEEKFIMVLDVDKVFASEELINLVDAETIKEEK